MKIVKQIASIAVKPFVERHLSKTRIYHYHNIDLKIPTEVFHPGFFFSTKLLLRYLLKLNLQGKTFLELGAGSGLISFCAAKEGAKVTATDINPIAVEYLEENKTTNIVDIQVIHSDLYDSIPEQVFDIIAVNPPYYKKDPETPAQHAWYCGHDGSYFSRFFNGLATYIHSQSLVLMALSEDCDIEMIKVMAANCSFSLHLVQEKKVLWETLYIFEIKKSK